MARAIEAHALAGLGVSKQRRRQRPAADVRAASQAVLERGGAIVPHPFNPGAAQHVAGDLSGDCMRPVLDHQDGFGHLHGDRDDQFILGGDAGGRYEPARSLAVKFRCRQCPACLKARAVSWAARSRAELQRAQALGLKVWFVTLTVAPGERYRWLSSLRQTWPGWDTMKPRDQFAELAKRFKREVRAYLTRMWAAGWRFRYEMALEHHRDGFPHAHLLMVSSELFAPLTKEACRERWHVGFSKAKLVRWGDGEAAKAAWYVSKYLAKEALTRICASRGWGDCAVTLPAVAGGQSVF